MLRTVPAACACGPHGSEGTRQSNPDLFNVLTKPYSSSSARKYPAYSPAPAMPMQPVMMMQSVMMMQPARPEVTSRTVKDFSNYIAEEGNKMAHEGWNRVRKEGAGCCMTKLTYERSVPAASINGYGFPQQQMTSRTVKDFSHDIADEDNKMAREGWERVGQQDAGCCMIKLIYQRRT